MALWSHEVLNIIPNRICVPKKDISKILKVLHIVTYFKPPKNNKIKTKHDNKKTQL